MEETGTGQAFIALIHQALRAYHCDDNLARLAQLVELAAAQAQPCDPLGRSVAAAVRGMIDAGLERLAQVDREAADLLTRRFIKGEPMAEIARSSSYSESFLYKHQRQAIAALAQIIWQAGEEARGKVALSAAQEAALATLPPRTFSRLFGATETLAKLKGFLAAQDGCWLVAVDGMGGMGKTALARAAVEELVCAGRFTQAIWLTARQAHFAWGHIQVDAVRPALAWPDLLAELRRALGLPPAAHDDALPEIRAALSRQPSVVVLDNLETAADIAAVVDGLARLVRPAKVLLTTRQRVAAHEGVTALTLAALSREDALAFIHHHAGERNVPAVLNASLADLVRIADVTGGSPLAIKLVVGQMHSRPLATVLADLTAARAGARDFFNFIFRYAWDRLSPAAQRLLLHMPLLDARGTGAEELAIVSDVAMDGEFWDALDELVNCSLLNVGCAGGRLLYNIHRLTEFFILSDLVSLPGSAVNGPPVV